MSYFLLRTKEKVVFPTCERNYLNIFGSEQRVNLQSDLNQKRCKIKIKIWGYFRVLKVTKVSSFRGSQRCLTKGQRHFQNVQAASHMAPASPLRRQGNVKLVKVITRQTPQPFNHACRHPHPDHPSRSSTSSPRSWSMRRAPGTSRCPAPRDESSEIWKWWLICWCISFDFAGLENFFNVVFLGV